MAQEQWFKDFIQSLTDWGKQEDSIDCILLVGSYARGTNHAASDVDLVILTKAKSTYIRQPDFIHQFGEVTRYQIEDYGACTSIRVWYEEEMEVEFGMVEPSWITEPLDKGTRRVLLDGYQVIVDKAGVSGKIKNALS